MSGYEIVEAWETARSRGAARRQRDVVPTDANEAANNAFNASPRARLMRAESEASGMRYGTDWAAEKEADEWLSAFPAEDDATALAAALEESEYGYAGRMAAESWAVFFPVTYGTADAVADAWAALGETAAHLFGGTVAVADASASGMRVYDPDHAYRRTRWARERQRPGYPWPTRWTADGRLVADTLPILYVNGRPVAQRKRDVTGRVNPARGGRKATHASNADRQRAYRERQRAEREAARAAATVDVAAAE